MAAAAIDVFPVEPVKETVLTQSERIIVTPHLGASTAEAQVNVAVDVAQEVVNVLSGIPARYAVNLPLVSPEAMSTVAPFLSVAAICGNIATQLAEGQLEGLHIKYEGDLADVDTAPLKAAVLGGVLRTISDERVSLVNASLIAESRGIRITEEKGPAAETYSNLVTVTAQATGGHVVVSGMNHHETPHIVRINDYWVDLEMAAVPYLLLLENDDSPGKIGAIGTILGNADINIAFMQVGRDRPRGSALMVLGLDNAIDEPVRQQVASVPGVKNVRSVRA